MKMQNATALVTGAGRGLGRALVQASVEAGARRVYATGRDLRRLEALAAEWPEVVVPLALDITDARSVAEAAARVGELSVLFNNAGVIAAGGVLASSPDAVVREFETNVFGTLAVTRAFLPALERAAPAGGAAIVNVLSVASLANVPLFGVYAAAKAASLSLTQALRVALADKGVRVHAVAYDMPKTSPELVAQAIVAGVEADEEDICPDPTSQQLYTQWQSDPRAVARALGAMTG
ncbi:MAG: SDR family NAD(P)-dependent oxidoreductase [Polyangiaceae bacterium]|nr:SDR family NAD(P)-dependent oxidoreductase [Polyangiaceae bacterium]